MLEPTPSRNNPYNRSILDYLDLVHIESDTKNFKLYKVEKLINR